MIHNEAPATSIREYDPAQDYPDVECNLREGGLYDQDRDNETLLSTHASSVLVAESEGVVVGNVYVNEGIMPVVWRLAVRQSHRHRGIGSLLLTAAENRLHMQGHPDVELFVGDNDDKLIEFYARRGYQDGGSLRSMWRML